MLAATIGMFSKESAVVLLAAMAIYDFTFGTGGARDRLPGYLTLALPLALFWYVRSRVVAGLAAAPVPFTDNPLVGAGFWTARLAAVKVVGKYLWLLVWPRDLSCDYSYNQIPLFACVAPTNQPPRLTPQQAAARTWIPDPATWAAIAK